LHHKNCGQLRNPNQYHITLSALKEGKNEINFQMDQNFFQKFDLDEPIKQAQLIVDIVIDKWQDILQCSFNIRGTLEVTCDRCLDSLTINLDTNNILKVKLGQSDEEWDADTVEIAKSGNVFDFEQYIYEFVMLGIPLQKVHPDNEDGESLCNAEMLNRIGIINEKVNLAAWQKLKGLKNL
jgi:uncharacterized protein